MPNKDPNVWQLIYIAVTTSSTCQGAFMATVIAFLRALYDKKEPKVARVILEAFLCGALALCCSSIVDVLGMPQSAGVTIGGAVGFIGVQSLRDFLVKFINRRIDKE